MSAYVDKSFPHTSKQTKKRFSALFFEIIGDNRSFYQISWITIIVIFFFKENVLEAVLLGNDLKK